MQKQLINSTVMDSTHRKKIKYLPPNQKIYTLTILILEIIHRINVIISTRGADLEYMHVSISLGSCGKLTHPILPPMT